MILSKINKKDLKIQDKLDKASFKNIDFESFEVRIHCHIYIERLSSNNTYNNHKLEGL